VAHEPNKAKLPSIVNVAERVIYYAVVLVLIGSVGIIFVSLALSLLQAPELGILETLLMILDRVLLVFIFVELLNTVEVTVREREIVAEPFLLIGLIAAVRRILLITAQLEQATSSEGFQTLLTELGVLTGLVLVLSVAIYLIRSTRRFEEKS
jgi:uncharacterized membrane protein (DUF373 family)